MADAHVPQVTDTPKKRLKKTRKRDELKKQRLSQHTVGPDCRCARFKCFDNIVEEEKQGLIKSFNELSSKDEQDSYLATCISVKEIARRRPRGHSSTQIPNEVSYTYKILVPRAGNATNVPVCTKALASIFGIGEKRLRRVKEHLSQKGFPPQDMRGKHGNRPHKLSDDQVADVMDHIMSFKGRESHYSRSKSRRLYLPEMLNITKMHALFKEQNPDSTISYESYRCVFNTKFSISFGYPRSDTCSKCDEFISKIQHVEASHSTSPENQETLDELRKLKVDQELHHRKAEVFYARKRAAKEKAKANPETLALAFDFQQELHLPNLTTNDVFYRRQLSLHSFNIHELAGDQVFVYAYDETIGKRGSDDVVSMLWHFLKNNCPAEVKHLELFCDSCGGQNKNYTMFRFLYGIVHIWKLFDSVKLSFPVRGHSYMECDRDFALINKKAPAQIPTDWFAVFRSSRSRPTPYNVIAMTQEDFFNFSANLRPIFKAVCPVPSRPIRELMFKRDMPSLMLHRDNWHGQMQSAVLITRGKLKNMDTALPQPQKLYKEPIPVSEAKFKDIQVLKAFCSPEHHPFYDSIPHLGSVSDNMHELMSSDADSD